MKTKLSAIECALAQFFDYAGMFAPAQLDLRTATRDYMAYRHGTHAWALGRLVISAPTLHGLGQSARDELGELRLSVIATSGDAELVQRFIDQGLRIEMIELKVERVESIPRWREGQFAGIPIYVEVQAAPGHAELLEAISRSGMRAKLRMGGTTADAFPSSALVAAVLKELAERNLAFKATAGLHHPLRSRHPLTYRPDSPSGLMHGFMNLLCASAVVWFGGDADQAARVLEEQDPRAWDVTAGEVRWRPRRWDADQLREVRERFLFSVGSCSFTEPMRDLEALGWL